MSPAAPLPGITFRYRGARVVPCFANFADPRLPVYCATRVQRGLITRRQALALRRRATRS
jgi:hypothetical protein